MDQATEQSDAPEPKGPVLDYERPDLRVGRVDGALRFIGMLVAMCGGFRQVGLAFGLAWFSGGLGTCLASIGRVYPDGGVLAMAFGAFVVGLSIPLSAKAAGSGEIGEYVGSAPRATEDAACSADPIAASASAPGRRT